MTFKISASHLKLFRLCPRSWYLKHVLRVPDDAEAGGKYLTRGNDFDRLVQLHVRGEATGDSGAPKLANRQLHEALRYLPRPKTAEVQFQYSVPDPVGGFVVVGKPDLRRPGVVKDTKTTSDRGPGRGAAEDRPAYALTDEHTPGGNLRPLAEDEQCLLYSWCELQLDPTLPEVDCEWIYVSKADCPHSWRSRAVLHHAEVEAWFDRVVRPTAAEMRALAESGLPADGVGANPDSCRRCFVRASCPGAFTGKNVYGVGEPTRERGSNMAFDLSKLKSPAATPAEVKPVHPAVLDPAEQLAAYLQAVAINRPPTQRPAPLTVGTIEGPGAAFLELEFEPEQGGPKAPATAGDAARRQIETACPTAAKGLYVTGEPPAPKARRGRPRKSPTPGAAPDAGESSDTVSAPDPKAGGADTAAASTPSAAPQTSSTTAGVPAPEGTPPKARRGRPRKNPGAVVTYEDTAEDAAHRSASACAPDPKVLEAAEARATRESPTIAPGCAPSVGDLAAAVSALIMAIQELECTGKTGRWLQDAAEALKGGVS